MDVSYDKPSKPKTNSCGLKTCSVNNKFHEFHVSITFCADLCRDEIFVNCADGNTHHPNQRKKTSSHHRNKTTRITSVSNMSHGMTDPFQVYCFMDRNFLSFWYDQLGNFVFSTYYVARIISKFVQISTLE